MTEFHGRVFATGKIVFDFPAQLIAYLKHLYAKTGDGAISARFYPLRSQRSDRQNRAFHALVTPWAKERGWTVDQLKDVLLGIAFGTIETVAPVTGEVTRVLAEPHSAQLDVTQFAHLIEEVLRVAAEDGYWLQAPDEYRLAKEAAAKAAEKAAAKAARNA